jgi:hypothetical protein
MICPNRSFQPRTQTKTNRQQQLTPLQLPQQQQQQHGKDDKDGMGDALALQSGWVSPSARPKPKPASPKTPWSAIKAKVKSIASSKWDVSYVRNASLHIKNLK